MDVCDEEEEQEEQEEQEEEEEEGGGGGGGEEGELWNVVTLNQVLSCLPAIFICLNYPSI